MLRNYFSLIGYWHFQKDSNGNFIIPDKDYVRGKVAVRRNYKNKEGKRETDYIDVVAYRQQASFIKQYVHDGDACAVCGEIVTGSYEKDGKTVYTTDLAIREVTNLEKRADTQTQPQTTTTQQTAQTSNQIDDAEYTVDDIGISDEVEPW